MRERATAVALSLAVGAGVFGAVQPKINGELGARLGSAMVASLVNFLVALAFVVIALSMRPRTRHLLRNLGSWSVPWWTLTAGFGGAIVVVAGAVSVETIGVAVFSVAFFAGQIVFGLLVDHLGLGPRGHRPITTARLQAVGLAVVAVIVAQVGRPVGDLAPGLVAFSAAAGAAVAFQSAFNGRITATTGDPIAATSVNVAVGTAALALIVGCLAFTISLDPLEWPSEPWLYTGGAFGVTIVLSLAVATAHLGVLRPTLAMLAAQLGTAFVVDWIVEEERPTIGVLIGALMILGAVALVGRQPTEVEAVAPT